MSKDKLTDYSSTADSNTDIGGISIAEGMSPSAVNNAIREQMSHLKDFASGTQAITSIAVDGGTIKLDGNYPTGSGNVALGDTALDSLTSANFNTGIGHQALTGAVSGGNNTALGASAGSDLTTGQFNAFSGRATGRTTSSGSYNSAFGAGALGSNTTGSYNVAIGRDAANTTTTTDNGTFVGAGAGQNSTSSDHNTYIGRYAGGDMTSGTKNTIIGRYAGNQGGLDIRTSSNYIVLSDGDGNPRLHLNNIGRLFAPAVYNNLTSSGANMVMQYTTGEFQRSTSSRRYKNTINDATHGLAELLALRPVTYKGNNDGDTIFGGLIAEEVHDAGLTEFVQYNDDGEPDALSYSNMVSLCIKAIQEQQATITALEARIAALESN